MDCTGGIKASLWSLFFSVFRAALKVIRYDSCRHFRLIGLASAADRGRACLPACLPACLSACLPACLPPSQFPCHLRSRGADQIPVTLAPGCLDCPQPPLPHPDPHPSPSPTPTIQPEPLQPANPCRHHTLSVYPLSLFKSRGKLFLVPKLVSAWDQLYSCCVDM